MPSWPAKTRISVKRLVMCCRVSQMDTEFLMSRIKETTTASHAKTAFYVNQFLNDFF